mgnify:FL=1
MRKGILFIVVFCLALGFNGCKSKPEEKSFDSIKGTEFRKDATLTITAPTGEVKAIYEIEIAATEAACTQGLMYRESMAENRGMLFDPKGPSETPFWMKNTYIPLDIIFIDKDKKIMHIAKNNTPFTEEMIAPNGIYRYVLELNAGQAEKHNLKIGDLVQWE